jgi:hypothetical protein
LAWTLSGVAFAQSSEQTIVLLPEGAELPDVVTDSIVPPKDSDGNYISAPQGVEHSADGLATANDARESGRAFGEAMTAQAQENRENNARGARPDVPPGQPPDDVTLPDLPDTPVTPAVPDRPEPPVTPPGRP